MAKRIAPAAHKSPFWGAVLEYAESIRSGKKIACKELRQAVERFFADIENPEYWIDYKSADFCIGIIEDTICHQQGEKIDGTELRGTPLKLEPFQKFIVYNLVGIKITGTEICKYHEALIFIPRKNGKTGFAASLAWALSLLYRKSGSKCYIASAALMQSLESFNFLKYNVQRQKEDIKSGGCVKIIDNNNEHSMTADLGESGSFFIRALAASPDTQDSLNANICICDEIHAFKTAKQYNLFKECQKAYTNKLLIGISTAGDNELGFLGKRLTYCRKVLNGTIEDEEYFIFICCADPDPETGEYKPPSPAFAPFAIFMQSSETVRTSVIIGLGSKLQVMQAQQVKNITSYDEIDLELPGKQKCAYFCIVSDQDNTFEFLSTLFFSFLFIRLIRYADSRCEGNTLPTKVRFILDEFPNCSGSIPDFQKKCSTIRSRGVSVAVVFQNVGQMKNRYPDDQWQEILGACDTTVFLGCTDMLTAEYFSDRIGIASVEVEGTMRELNSMRITNYTPSYRETNSLGRRQLMTPDEILRIPPDEELVFIRGQ